MNYNNQLCYTPSRYTSTGHFQPFPSPHSLPLRIFASDAQFPSLPERILLRTEHIDELMGKKQNYENKRGNEDFGGCGKEKLGILVTKNGSEGAGR